VQERWKIGRKWFCGRSKTCRDASSAAKLAVAEKKGKLLLLVITTAYFVLPRSAKEKRIAIPSIKYSENLPCRAHNKIHAYIPGNFLSVRCGCSLFGQREKDDLN